MEENNIQQLLTPGRTVQLDLDNYSAAEIPVSSTKNRSRNETPRHQPVWSGLEWKSKYRFWDNNEMFMYSQMKLKYWLENRKEKSYEPYLSAQELIARYLRPLKYRQKNIDDESSVDTRSKSSDRRSAVVLGPEWWTKLPALSNDELCTHCWKCAAEQVSMKEAEKNYTTVMSGKVEKELKVIIQNWRKDKAMMGFLSLFGGNFYISEYEKLNES
ncbi:uncharacterized protein LOC120343326 [Styela clava]